MNVKMPTLTFGIENIFLYNKPIELNTVVGWNKGRKGAVQFNQCYTSPSQNFSCSFKKKQRIAPICVRTRIFSKYNMRKTAVTRQGDSSLEFNQHECRWTWYSACGELHVNSVHDAETSCAVAYSKRVVDKNQWTSRS
jgi:hypothetical protein